MKQGTVSVLIGCHSPMHSLLVLLAWHKLYGRWPRPWQVVCIFLHDVGHWGLDYLDDPAQKAQHWRGGTSIAHRLFGWEGACLVGGHCESSLYDPSDLYKPDKYSWLLAPTWWLRWNNWIEPQLLVPGSSSMEQIRWFRREVWKSVESGEFRSTHDMYLERKNRAST